MDLPAVKKCTKCLETKPLMDFYINQKGKISSHCKFCRYRSTQIWRERNKWHVSEYNKRYVNLHKNDPDFINRTKQNRKRYYQEHREIIIKKTRQYENDHRERTNELHRASYKKHRVRRSQETVRWRKSHPEKVKEYNRRSYQKRREDNIKRSIAWAKANPVKKRAWRKAHPEIFVHHALLRRVRLAGAAIYDLTREQWHAIKDGYGNRCVYCHKKFKRLTMDHVIPVSKGGNHTASNIVPACRSCNSKKKDHDAPPFQPVLSEMLI